MKVKVPCKECEERTATCHATCLKWKEFEAYKKEREAVKDKEYKEKQSLVYSRPIKKRYRKGQTSC